MWGWALQYWWWALALILIAGEVLVPGFFLLWIGIAAGLMGFAVWWLPAMGVLAQAILFVVLAFASCAVYWRYVRHALARGDDPAAHTLSRRGEQLIGQRFQLIEAIVNGRGKASVGDGQWLVRGPELPAGTQIEVIGVDGAVLSVRAAND